jgi:Cd2+/Zn2+-exporting ATPase
MGVVGSAAAMETADVALLTNDLSRVAEAIAIGHLCLVKIRQNITFSIVAKGIVLLLSLMGYTGLWEAVVTDMGTALVVILNGMTVLSGVKESKEQANEVEGCVAEAAEHSLSHADAAAAASASTAAEPLKLKSAEECKPEVSSCAHKKC